MNPRYTYISWLYPSIYLLYILTYVCLCVVQERAVAAEAFAKLYFMGRVDVDVNVLARMLYLLFTPDTQLDAPLRQVNLLECVVVSGKRWCNIFDCFC